MRFINKGEPVQVRQDDGLGRFKWECVRKGETIDLPEGVGLRYGFERVGEKPKTTEGKIGKKKVETKQIESNSLKKKEEYRKTLEKIKGIGRKRVEDIIIAYPTEEDLIRAISNKERLPFRDDIEIKLRRKYGRG